MIFEKIQSVLSYSVPTIVLLGFLIFVHELGHFLVAKYNKVRVETFSLGFGPKILKFVYGETTYCLSAIPLGGYVKMFGDDPTATIAEEDKQYSFTHKKLGQRVAVVLAGPLMNFFIAIILYTIMSINGEQMLPPVIGDLESKTEAFISGFRPGDKIVEIDQKKVQTWDDIQEMIESHPDQKLQFKVQRNIDSKIENADITATPKLVENKNPLSWSTQVGEIAGLGFSSKIPFIGISNQESIAYKNGLRTGDLITEINSTKLEVWRDLETLLIKSLQEKKDLVIKVQHDPLTAAQESKEAATSEVKIEWNKLAKIPLQNALTEIGIESSENFLADLEKESPAFKAGMQKSDKIVAIDNQEVSNFEQIAAVIRSFKSENSKALDFSVIRDSKLIHIPVQPSMKERSNIHGKEETRYEIGIKPLIITAQTSVTIAASNPFEALKRGIYLSYKWTSATILSFVRLAQARISPKNIGGFFSIGIMAKKSWQIGLSQYLSTMGILSLNLFILNLLPIPVLDGGHLLFYTIEFFQGAPLSLRKMEMAQQVGMILLLALMVFAMFNDITRLLS